MNKYKSAKLSCSPKQKQLLAELIKEVENMKIPFLISLSKLLGSAQQFKQPHHYLMKSTAWPFIPLHVITWWCEAVPRQRSTQNLNFSLFAYRLKKETHKLYNLKKIFCFCCFSGTWILFWHFKFNVCEISYGVGWLSILELLWKNGPK